MISETSPVALFLFSWGVLSIPMTLYLFNADTKFWDNKPKSTGILFAVALPTVIIIGVLGKLVEFTEELINEWR